VIGKTGYTRPAKRCFVGAAADGDREIVVAVLGSNDLWGDTKRLVAFGLGEEEVTPIIEARRPEPPVPALHARGAGKSAQLRSRDTKVQIRVARGARKRATQEGDAGEVEAAPVRWVVEIGPFHKRTDLARTRIVLSRRGFRNEAVGSSIRLGTFPARPRANELAARLRKNGYRPTVVALR
jgi:D-alanyl-D-alanine carboxypeptidase